MYDWSPDARLQRPEYLFQLLLKGCTIEAAFVNGYLLTKRFSCCWKDVRLKQQRTWANKLVDASFSCCWKDVRLKPFCEFLSFRLVVFQLLLKGCTIEAAGARFKRGAPISFSCCWKDVRLKLNLCKQRNGPFEFQLLLKGCTIEAEKMQARLKDTCFSCCWKDVRLKHKICLEKVNREMFQLLLKGCTIEAIRRYAAICLTVVSVVVERMYDWSSSRE